MVSCVSAVKLLDHLRLIEALRQSGSSSSVFISCFCQSVQSFSHVQLFATPWTSAHQASLFITNSQSLPKLMSTESVMPSNHLIFCCFLLLLPSVLPDTGVFSSELTLRIRWPKYQSFCFNISPSNEHPGLIFFRMDGLDLLTVQGTLKSLLHHSSKPSILGTQYEELRDLLELTPKKRCPFHYRGLECKSRKSRITWSNR